MEYHLEKFFQLSIYMLCIAGMDGYFKRVNPAFEKTLGWTAQELMSRPFLDFVHPDDVAATREEMEKLASGIPTVSFDNRYRCADATYKHLHWTSAPQPEGGLLFGIARDVTKQKEAQQKILEQAQELEEANKTLARLATTDSLTGLKNRRAFEEVLESHLRLALRAHRPLSVMLADVDRFKNYNDDFGHPAGDRVLRSFAEILLESVRGSDFVARYGGEEFALIMPETDSEGSVNLGERLRTRVEGFTWPNRQLTASFGVSTFHDEAATLWNPQPNTGALIIQADKALYYSKARGRNRLTHASVLDQR